MSDIKQTEDIFLKLIAATKNINDLEAIRIKALGKKGEVTKLMKTISCLLYTSPSPRDLSTSRMPSSA